MKFFTGHSEKKEAGTALEKDGATPAETPATMTPKLSEEHNAAPALPAEAEAKVTVIAVLLGAIASVGGFIFGYESGQISGFLQMSNFLDRFGENGAFSAARQGTIVGLLSAGTLVGCLASGWICDKYGRRYTISASAFFYIIGVIIEITSETQWVQFAMGRFVAGLGIGALSTSVPMYQSESVPKKIRGTVVASYQLLITLGIWTAYMVNWGTKGAYTNSAQWRIPNGLSTLWAIMLGVGILFMPESPRFAYRMNRVDEARKSMARLNGVGEHSILIESEIAEIEAKLEEEREGGDTKWYEAFTGDRMLYRIILGMILQAGQQLTGANFFFYYGTTIFRSTGISDSFITSIILGSVNVGSTVVGLWIVKNCGRRISLMVGAAVMFGCFMIYSFLGHFGLGVASDFSQTAGYVLIAFTCIFIAAFATTWGPLVWAVVGELYPARYRATAMALATASNWLFNFLISFFTTFITNDIDYYYGLVFGWSCFALFWIVYFFMIETKDRSLEEIDTMYILKVNPRKSTKWTPRDQVTGTDHKEATPTSGLFVQAEHTSANEAESAV
ncbi:Hexose transporter [Lachnellula occidentalis]|uniref:Hexose transporter n=1 Tax=Lachnellula occidentalis TaxID=215460 RepID=A0A8H8RSZ2_9HELO|nr:Hexose transporter [Lachnellula occidentalis]